MAQTSLSYVRYCDESALGVVILWYRGLKYRLLLLSLLLLIAVISIAPYLTDKGERTALYKINNDVYIKFRTSKIIII